MTKIKKYIPHLIILLIIFFAGRWSKDNNSPELEAKFKQERKLILDQLQKKQIKVSELENRMREIDSHRVQDSLFYADRLSENQTAYNRLKKKYNEINLNRATHSDLDSLIGVLFPN